jgi:hypothetical protein
MFSFFGCVEQIDLSEINGTTSGRIVVEGTITNEMKSHFVKLTRTNVAIPDAPAEPVSGAVVSISDGLITYFLQEIDTLPGIYSSDETVQGEVGKTYTLSIQSDGEIYSGSSTMQPVTPFTSETEIFRAPNRIQNPIPGNFDIYEVQFPKVRYGAIKPSKVLYYALEPVSNTLRGAFHYEFPGVDPQGFLLNFAGQNKTIFVEDGTEITQFKYSLTEEHYVFMRAVFAQTDFKGGLFDRISTNVPTNMNNGALGFFGASAVISRTFVFNKDLLK